MPTKNTFTSVAKRRVKKKEFKYHDFLANVYGGAQHRLIIFLKKTIMKKYINRVLFEGCNNKIKISYTITIIFRKK